MKQLSVIITMLCVVQVCNAQTWDEIFNQKKTQKQYLLDNIAALKVYASYLGKGYTIAREGLNTVRSIKKGDFNLHSQFFTSLGLVHPSVKQYAKVAGIIAMQINIAQQVAAIIKQCKHHQQFTVIEINYLQSVFNRLLDDCAKSLDELSTVLDNGHLQMTDDERIKRIDAIYTDMQDKQVFVQSFGSSTNGLAVQRSNETKDIAMSKKLNSLP